MFGNITVRTLPIATALLMVTIGPLCHYLITSSGFSGMVKGDLSMPALQHDDGAVSLIPSFSNVTQSDTVGMNALVPFHYEGTPLPPFDASNTDRAYSRVGTDTNDNSRDFIMRAPSSPQNSTFCGSR
jgi:hypothetical protein